MAPIINEDIKPRGIASAYVGAPFDLAKEALESQGYRIISLEENARLRVQEGEDSYVSSNGNWTAEDFGYIPEKGIFLSKYSPICENARKATRHHKRGEEFYLNDQQVEKVLANSVSISVNQKPIPTNRFADDAITVYAFGDFAQKYGDFLKESGISEMPIWLCNSKEKPFARKLWFRRLDCRSGLLGYWDLGDDDGVRGVKVNAEGVA